MISIPNSHFYTVTTKQEIEFYSPRGKISYTAELSKLHCIVHLRILNSASTSVLPTHTRAFLELMEVLALLGALDLKVRDLPPWLNRTGSEEID